MEDKFVSTLHPYVDIGAGIYLLFIAVVTIVGNVVVLATAVKCSSHLKSPDLLSINLAITDLGMAFSMYPLAIASAWNHVWIGGEPSCQYYGFAGFFFGVASMMTLMAMAVIRYLMTSAITTISVTIKKKIIYIVITCIWIYALLWALLPLVGWGHYGPEPFGVSCTIAWAEFHDSTSGFSFILSMFVLCTMAPAITVVTCYIRIAWKLHKAYKEIRSYNRIPHTAKVEKRLTAMAILVSIGFLVFWTPYAFVSFWSVFHSSAHIPPTVSLLPCLFAKSSTAFNPIIYYTFSKMFRQKVKQLKCCCGWRIHLSQSKSTVEIPEVSVIWAARDNIQISSALRTNKGQSSTTMIQ
ncbi:opsin-5-like [Pseudophryne corroboree]|uniref:opsin-5-like n=1 Tax=Pseudophryne corroboree TaxID=495146 RepID=UPI0030816174